MNRWSTIRLHLHRALHLAAAAVVCFSAPWAAAQHYLAFHQQPPRVTRQAPPAARREAPTPSRAPAPFREQGTALNGPGSAPNAPQPSARPAAGPGSNGNRQQNNPGAAGQGFENQHLGQWLQSHRGMSMDQQQSELSREPGFRRLNPEQQQRLQGRLAQLQRMSPEQQQRTAERTEQMERLRPEQRQQVRDAMAQVGHLPEYRRSAVAHAFYALRDMPPAQRQAYMNSAQYRAQFNDQERSAITGLLGVVPIYGPLQPH